MSRAAAYGKFGGWALATAALLLFAACGGSSSITSSSPPPPSTVNNTQPVEVNLGPTDNYADGIFTSVTVCAPGTSNCQTIPNILVDTGSSGLRILASETSLNLPAVTDGSGNPLGECTQFVDAYTWGAVDSADVEIAGEKASAVPIQIIGGADFSPAPSACTDSGLPPNDTLESFGAYGVLGVGVFQQDCGPGCAPGATPVPPAYFSCPSSGCSAIDVPLGNQVQNPVWLFPQDNNGVLISLPSIAADGAATVAGSLIFGIGTQSDNALNGAQVYTTDDDGNFSTTYPTTGQSIAYSESYIDSGSNGLFFLDSPTTGLSACTGANTGWYCPSAPTNFTATNTGLNGTSGTVSFTIENADTLFNTNDAAFDDLGGPNPDSFDWGLAFFFGRNVFTAIQGQNTPAGPGPYWAY